MAKRPPVSDTELSPRFIVPIARWVTAHGRVIFWPALLALPAIVLIAQLDPHRQERRAREEADQRAAKIQAEAALASVPVRIAPDGVAEITFKSLDFIPISNPRNPKTGAVEFSPLAPARIKAFDQRRVRITGYMLPTRSDHGNVRECLIVANQLTCCFGYPPRFCDFILAHLETKVAPSLMDTPVCFEGTMHIADVTVNDWSALYTIDCTKVTP